MLALGGSAGTADSYYLGPTFGADLRFRFFPFSSNTNNGIDLFFQYSREILKNTGQNINETNKLQNISGGLDLRIQKFYFGAQFNYSTGSISGVADVPSYHLTTIGPRAGVLLQIDQGLNFRTGIVTKFGSTELALPSGKKQKFIQEYAIEAGIEFRIFSAQKYKKY